MANVLIGTVMAYAGDVPDTGLAVKIQPAAGGASQWLLCNGAALNGNPGSEYVALYAVIGARHGNGSDGGAGPNFNLPDYRGYFLRGVTGPRTDPKAIDLDRGDRVENHPGGNSGNIVGSVQLSATAMPTGGPFTTADAGGHSFGNILVGNRPGSHDSGHDFDTPDGHVTIPDLPDHHHTVNGGDHETRPKNAYVHWIIAMA
jgi:hypothetical protein